MDEVHLYMCLHIASIKLTAVNLISFFPSLIFISFSWFPILAEGFRNDHVAALRSATEKNEVSGYVNVPCSSKLIQSNSTAAWPKF